MTRRLMILMVALVVGLAAPAWAGPDEGWTAYQRGDYETALRQWRPLAEQGYARAQWGLGAMYNMGHGVPKDYAEAARWFREAAEQGLAAGQYSLGAMYNMGHGVPKDYIEAVRWLRKAAEQGEGVAQYDLGVMYGTGRGVPQDYVLAHMWFNLAAAQGDNVITETARENRDIAEERMTPEQIAEAQRLAREWKPKAAE